MFHMTPRLKFMKLFGDNRPRAVAELRGSDLYPDLIGFVYFYDVSNGGILIESEVFGLPEAGSLKTPAFLGFTYMKREIVPTIFPTREDTIIRIAVRILTTQGIFLHCGQTTDMRGLLFMTTVLSFTILSGGLLWSIKMRMTLRLSRREMRGK